MLSMNYANLLTHYLVVLTMLLVTTGCSVVKMPMVPDDVKAQHPSNMPNPVVTNFNEACACIDDMMLINKVAPIYIASDGLVNYTSDRSISAGGKEMLITTLSRMAVRSKGVIFVAYGSDLQNILNLNGAHPDNKSFYVPDYFIRGGVTQHVKNIWSGQEGDGTSVSIDNGDLINHNTFYSIVGSEEVSGSNSNSASYGTVTLDMSAGFVSTLQIIPGASSANTLAMSGGATNSRSIDLTIGNLGYSYHLSNNRNLDFNQAFRSLIQVGAIEIIGKIQGIPYWRCLANAGTVESQNEQLRQQFIELYKTDSQSIVRFVQNALKDLHYYNGEIHGNLDLLTREALQKYQQHMGLMASGTLGYDTFRMMNIFTPARDTAYVPWWENHTFIPSAIIAKKDAGRAK